MSHLPESSGAGRLPAWQAAAVATASLQRHRWIANQDSGRSVVMTSNEPRALRTSSPSKCQTAEPLVGTGRPSPADVQPPMGVDHAFRVGGVVPAYRFSVELA